MTGSIVLCRIRLRNCILWRLLPSHLCLEKSFLLRSCMKCLNVRKFSTVSEVLVRWTFQLKSHTVRLRINNACGAILPLGLSQF
ncbi:hypothetical protein AB6A40_004037 [Gnathostoma spinigerum]|uniref:Uncharacterized protein n=1 Tax=Gnathostoma spinigerum TaxID=75299 RepID=A0ABD6EBG6_9BILA